MLRGCLDSSRSACDEVNKLLCVILSAYVQVLMVVLPIVIQSTADSHVITFELVPLHFNMMQRKAGQMDRVSHNVIANELCLLSR